MEGHSPATSGGSSGETSATGPAPGDLVSTCETRAVAQSLQARCEFPSNAEWKFTVFNHVSPQLFF
jgi:hypothetical protein